MIAHYSRRSVLLFLLEFALVHLHAFGHHLLGFLVLRLELPTLLLHDLLQTNKVHLYCRYGGWGNMGGGGGRTKEGGLECYII